jgi:ribonuclease HI
VACVYEIQRNGRPEKYVSTCSDYQAALKALKTAKTTSPLVQQYQKALIDISTYYSVGLFWVSSHSSIGGSEIADGLAREGNVQFVGPVPALGVSKQNARRKLKH